MKTAFILKKTTTIVANRLDESNGIVENVLEMKTTAKKAPWFLRFAPKAKGIVSFVQNLLTREEGVRGGQVSAFFQSAAAVVVGVVGIGLLASPFLIQANDEEETNDAPQVCQLYVANSGSIGFEVKFDVSAPSDSDKLLNGFELWQGGEGLVDDALWPQRAKLYSVYCDWLSIPGFDGGPPLPYPGYNQYSPAFDFTIKGLEFHSFVLAGPPFEDVHSVVSSVAISLYVTVNSEGALESMSAWAVDSDGDSYEVSVYYSAGGGWDGSFHPF